MKIFLIRHGTQIYPHDEIGRKLVSGTTAPLAEIGKLQITKLGQELRREGSYLDALYTSPVLRAQQTSGILSAELSIPNTYIVDDLKEIFPNSAEGKAYEELRKIRGDVFTHPFGPDQESLDHLIRRTREAIEYILQDAKQRGHSLLGIVSHGDPLSAMDWSINNTRAPEDHDEMQDAFYLQQAEACEYVDPNLGVKNEGRIIRVEEVDLSEEGFRDSRRKERGF